MPSINFVTVVWGEEFTDKYLNYFLPSQLSPHNLPAVADLDKCRYTIYTSIDNIKKFVMASSYVRLSKIIDVKFVLPDNIDKLLSTKYEIMNALQMRELSISENDYISFLSPDVIYSDGFFEALSRDASNDLDATMVFGPRISSRALAVLEEKYRGEDGVICMRGSEISDLLLEYPHAITRSLTYDASWDGHSFKSDWPSALLWQESSAGTVAHSFHLHPILVKKGSFSGGMASETIDSCLVDSFTGGEIKIRTIIDSDEACCVEVSNDELVQNELDYSKLDLLYFLGWAVRKTTVGNRDFARQPIIFRSTASSKQVIFLMAFRSWSVINYLLSHFAEPAKIPDGTPGAEAAAGD